MKKETKKELVLYDYIAVSAMIKYARQNKKKITVEKLGNDWAGYYYKVIIEDKK